MSGFVLYIISLLDAINILLGLGGLALIVWGIFAWWNPEIEVDDDGKSHHLFDAAPLSLQNAGRIFVAGIACWIIATAVPTTKSGLYIYVLPKLSNGEIVSTEVANTLKGVAKDVLGKEK